MKLVVQRVRQGKVTIFDHGDAAPRVTGEIGRGLVILVGFRLGDQMDAVARMVKKVLELRIFEDEAGKMNRSVVDIDGGLLAVSQFTLYGDARRGRRPSFTEALPPAEAEPMYRRFVQLLSGSGLTTASGEFGAKMEVEIINDGPVTIILDDDVTQS
jgi:D-tyrosyl-tRNA(Tyr) deacylase